MLEIQSMIELLVEQQLELEQLVLALGLQRELTKLGLLVELVLALESQLELIKLELYL